MASRLIVRGAKIDYVNRNGHTALHIMVESKNKQSVKFLLAQGANPHIMDMQGDDCCDKAKRNGLVNEIPEFNNCNIKKKIIPQLPDGSYVDYKTLPIFK